MAQLHQLSLDVSDIRPRRRFFAEWWVLNDVNHTQEQFQWPRPYDKVVEDSPGWQRDRRPTGGGGGSPTAHGRRSCALHSSSLTEGRGTRTTSASTTSRTQADSISSRAARTHKPTLHTHISAPRQQLVPCVSRSRGRSQVAAPRDLHLRGLFLAVSSSHCWEGPSRYCCWRGPRPARQEHKT